MKVLLINASPNREGNTSIALSEVAQTLASFGVGSEIFWIGNHPIRGCTACGACTQKPGSCVYDDDITNSVITRASECDAFVFGSPVYYGQPAGQLLCLVQRMLYSASSTFYGKPVANIAVCRRGGATAALQTMNMPWMMTSCPIVTSQYWNIAYGLTPGETLYDAEGLLTMRNLARNIARLLGVAIPSHKEISATDPRTPTNMIRCDLKP